MYYHEQKKGHPFFGGARFRLAALHVFVEGRSLRLRYVCVALCLNTDGLASLPVRESKSRAANRNSASLKKRVPLVLISLPIRSSVARFDAAHFSVAVTFAYK